jgi:hypothetical protein
MSIFSRLFGRSGREVELSPEEVYEWQEKLGACDYDFCVVLLREQFEKKRPGRKLLALFEAYKKAPCLKTAVAMIGYDGSLLGLFANSANVKKLRESMSDDFEGE